jgi:phosphoribosylanthranilate isomerase
MHSLVTAFAASGVRAPSSPCMSLRAVKVCGVVTASDANMVARVIREEMPPNVHLLLGMIVWPGSRRSVNRQTARDIAEAALEADATPVGVFVDETATEIAAACKEIGLDIAQLHGSKCRSSVLETALPSSLSVIDVIDVSADGSFVAPVEGASGGALWQLYDAKGGGTGQVFNWARFVPPTGDWFLAGGLNPENIADAVHVLRPTGLDVASGVAKADGCAKDEQRLRLFLSRAWAAEQACSQLK